MKSAALELGPYHITANALFPGLIDTALTRHEERYAQVLEDAGKQPTGSTQDEEEARKILSTKTPLGVPCPEMSRRRRSSSPLTLHAWFRVRPSMLRQATAPIIPRDGIARGPIIERRFGGKMERELDHFMQFSSHSKTAYISKLRPIDQALSTFWIARGWRAFQASRRDTSAVRYQASSSCKPKWFS